MRLHEKVLRMRSTDDESGGARYSESVWTADRIARAPELPLHGPRVSVKDAAAWSSEHSHQGSFCCRDRTQSDRCLGHWK